MLPGAHSVGVLDRAAEVEHGEHGEDHHHTLEQQGELKLLPYPARTQPNTNDIQEVTELIQERTYKIKSNTIDSKLMWPL